MLESIKRKRDLIAKTMRGVQLDQSFDNKTIPITGGTGSFGKIALKRFLKEGVGEVRIFSRDASAEAR